MEGGGGGGQKNTCKVNTYLPKKALSENVKKVVVGKKHHANKKSPTLPLSPHLITFLMQHVTLQDGGAERHERNNILWTYKSKTSFFRALYSKTKLSSRSILGEACYHSRGPLSTQLQDINKKCMANRKRHISIFNSDLNDNILNTFEECNFVKFGDVSLALKT